MALWLGIATATHSVAAPYAALVMDARTGEVLYAKNADTRLHPASLTKMMTLYIAFEAIEHGEISLDRRVKISKNAANEPPSKLGLKAGQSIALRYLIRAAAIKSANDAATAIGEAIAGSESAFADRMNRTARALGMKNTTFRNANGLTAKGHLSSARDMTILGRRLFFDYPQYYNIFSRRSTDAGLAKVNNTNRRFLDAYKGADGIKTGYTGAAGFNLTASAERGNKRIIATVFGGTSTAQRNAKMAELLDLGFGSAPRNATTKKPEAPAYIAQDQAEDAPGGAGKTIRLVTTLTKSPRPKPRPGQPAPPQELLIAMSDDISDVLAEVKAEPVPTSPSPEPRPEGLVVAEAEVEEPAAEVVAEAEVPVESTPEETVATAEAEPVEEPTAVAEAAPAEPEPVAAPEPVVVATAPAEPTAPPKARPQQVVLASVSPTAMVEAPKPRIVTKEPVIITRVSTSGGRHWGINVGRFPSRDAAERALLKTALAESNSLAESLRKVVSRSGGYDANFVGMSREQADLACRRLQARQVQCFTMGP